MTEKSIKSSKRAKNVLESTMNIIFIICGLVAVFSVFAIAFYLIYFGGPAIWKIGPINFLLGQIWQPSQNQFGILPFILSSIIGTFGAILIGVPISLFTAIFLAMLAPKSIANVLRIAVELLAGIPSVVYGLLGAILIVPQIRLIFNISSGNTLISAIVVLTIMILPTIVSVSETTLRAVPQDYNEASLALGATQIQTIFKVLIPAGKSGIVTGIVLGTGRAIGEAMAVMMVAGNVPNMPKLLESIRLLTTGVVMEWGYSSGLHREALYGVGLILFIFIMVINIFLNKLLKKAVD